MPEERGRCGCCGKDCKLTVDGMIWHHHPTGPDAEQCYASPDSKRCKGAGERPEGAKAQLAGDVRFLCRVPSGPTGCGHQVQLTSNHRARSHLTPHGEPCAEGGSAFPIAVGPDGYRADTVEWTEEDWTRALLTPEQADARGLHWPSGTPATRRVEDVGLPTAYARPGEPGFPDTDLPHDRRPDPHRHEADIAIAEVERIRNEEDADYDQALRDGLAESRLRMLSRADLADLAKAEGEYRLASSAAAAMEMRDEDRDELRSQSDAASIFDPTHVLTTDLGPEIHPGEAGDCRLPGCCTHPGGFTYGDDGNGHSGSVCMTCGADEPEPCRHPDGFTDNDPEEDDGEGIYYRCPHCGELEAEERAADRAQDILDNLDVGVLFVRHTARPPLNQLIYRVQAVTDFCVQVTVVSAGAHAGRTGELTDLSEEITCTDLNGTPRPRRDRATDGTLPSSPGPQPSSTPSLSAPGTPDRSSAPSSTPPTTPTATPKTAPRAAGSRKATSSGPTARAVSSTPSARKRTEVADAFSTAKQATSESDKYDRYGRYKLLHPITGKAVNWTRATTYAKSIQDTFALSQWAQRMTLKGAALRPDIVAAVSTLDVKEDKDKVNTLVEDAKKAAGNKVAANLGTAVHAFTEDRDKALVGQPVKAKVIPDKLRPTVDAYELLLRDFGLEPVPGLIEFTTGVVQYEIAGTSDRCYRVTRDITFTINKRTVTLYAGEYVIGDVKTGADLSYGWVEICIQLAVYAQGLNTSGVWSWETGTWGKPTLPDNPDVLLKVRTDVALVPHLPVDRKPQDDLATLYAIDLDAGWAAAVLCGQVRATRKLGGLATPLSVADVEESPAQVVRRAPVGGDHDGEEPASRVSAVAASRPVTLEDKARIVTTQQAASAVWKEAVAARTPKAEVDKLVQIMQSRLASLVEKGA
jgi:hypothetical protein